jgi:hypothetical protein
MNKNMNTTNLAVIFAAVAAIALTAIVAVGLNPRVDSASADQTHAAFETHPEDSKVTQTGQGSRSHNGMNFDESMTFFTYNDLSVEHVSKEAIGAIVGKVVSKSDHLREDKGNFSPYSKATIKIEEVITGNFKAGETIEVQALGNSIDKVANGADVPKDKKLVLFLGYTSDGGDTMEPGYYVYGDALGEFVEDSSDGKFKSKMHESYDIEDLKQKIKDTKAASK